MDDDFRGIERRHDGSVFTDEQVRRIKELFDERAEIHAGRAAMRIFLWVAGTLGTGAAAIILAYLGLKA